MVDCSDRWSARWFVLPILVVLLVLGHACELPAFADMLASFQPGGEAHGSADGHHASEQTISCDVIDVASNAGQLQLAPALEVISVVFEGIHPAPARVVARPFKGPAKLVVRPPLFLLHASLLI